MEGGLIEWVRDAGVGPAPPCPNCGDASDKAAVLLVAWPDGGRVPLLRCTACGCGFFPGAPADYTDPTWLQPALAFYLQQNANIRGMASNMASLGFGPGTRLLEVGCGYGFGLDFARRTLGWVVSGLDPSPYAGVGRVELGLPIELGYLVEDDPAYAGQYDVVMASEVLEHVADPRAFIRTLCSAIRPGGMLLLTTPNVEAARPDASTGGLLPLLSIGYHLVLQSPASAAGLLRGAGLVEVDERADGFGLVARGMRPGGAAPAAAAAQVAVAELYRAYLRDATAAVAEDGDVWIGLQARGYRQAVIDGDLVRAGAIWGELDAGCRRRFGYALDDGPVGDALVPLEEIRLREPIVLGPLLYHRGIAVLLAGGARAEAEPWFAAAVPACRRLQKSLEQGGSSDPDIEDIGRVAAAELTLCLIERRAPDLDLGPLRRGGTPALEPYRERAFVSLVNAGLQDAAGEMPDVVQAAEAAHRAGAVLRDTQLDVLYCAATRELQVPSGSPARALAWLDMTEAACARTSQASGQASGQPSGPAVTLLGPIAAARALAVRIAGPVAAEDPPAMGRATPSAPLGALLSGPVGGSGGAGGFLGRVLARLGLGGR